MTTIVATNDTIRVKAEFKDYAAALLDADSQAVTFTAFDAETLKSVATAAATRQSLGVYYYDWLVPATEKGYILEMKGNFSTKPQLKRMRVKAKFKPAA